jgi:nitrite reductase/ring-hydroxylating ferredoxin subunit
MTSTRSSPAVHEFFDRVAALEAIDQPAQAVGKAVRDTVPAGPVKDGLSGTWLGHALHPLLTDLPIGTWTSALLLDWLGGKGSERAADRLIGIGLAATLPAGRDRHERVGRLGGREPAGPAPRVRPRRREPQRHRAVHRVARRTPAWSARARQAVRPGGRGCAGRRGWLGGHLSYAEGIGVDQTAFEEPPEGWTPVLRESELPEGESRYAEIGGVGVLLARVHGEVHALSNRCSHRGGPLDEGELSNGCVTCPWHGSVFRLTDGSVVRGPAAYRQPAWRVRVRDGLIEVAGPTDT